MHRSVPALIATGLLALPSLGAGLPDCAPASAEEPVFVYDPVVITYRCARAADIIRAGDVDLIAVGDSYCVQTTPARLTTALWSQIDFAPFGGLTGIGSGMANAPGYNFAGGRAVGLTEPLVVFTQTTGVTGEEYHFALPSGSAMRDLRVASPGSMGSNIFIQNDSTSRHVFGANYSGRPGDRLTSAGDRLVMRQLFLRPPTDDVPHIEEIDYTFNSSYLNPRSETLDPGVAAPMGFFSHDFDLAGSESSRRITFYPRGNAAPDQPKTFFRHSVTTVACDEVPGDRRGVTVRAIADNSYQINSFAEDAEARWRFDKRYSTAQLESYLTHSRINRDAVFFVHFANEPFLEDQYVYDTFLAGAQRYHDAAIAAGYRNAHIVLFALTHYIDHASRFNGSVAAAEQFNGAMQEVAYDLPFVGYVNLHEAVGAGLPISDATLAGPRLTFTGERPENAPSFEETRDAFADALERAGFDPEAFVHWPQDQTTPEAINLRTREEDYFDDLGLHAGDLVSASALYQLAWARLIQATDDDWTRCAADIDASGDVDFADFLLLAAEFGQGGRELDSDLDKNKCVDFADFLLLTGEFGIDDCRR